MKKGIALLLMVAVSGPALGTEFTVENKMPRVVNRMTTRTVFASRSPVGHTHTCRNGHTWDHQANPTHNCRICGSSQFVQDRVARPVTVGRTEQVYQVQSIQQVQATPITVSNRIVVQQPRPVQYVTQPVRQLMQSNCVNGNCSYVR